VPNNTGEMSIPPPGYQFYPGSSLYCMYKQTTITNPQNTVLQ